MSKKTTRQNKAYVKKQKSYKRYQNNINHEDRLTDKERHSNKFVYIALDTCTIIDMVKYFVDGQKPRNVADAKYAACLRSLLNGDVYNEFGQKNQKGHFVLCLLPGVKEELSREDGTLNKHTANFLTTRLFDLKISSDPTINYTIQI